MKHDNPTTGTKCPRCGSPMEAQPVETGAALRCRACGLTMYIPVPKEKPEPDRPQRKR